MSKQNTKRPDYGNWVSRKSICLLGGLTLAFLALSVISYLFLIGAILLLLSFGFFAYAYYKFSPQGGNVQVQIRNLVLDRVDWNGEGKFIDIGCGNGALTIELAKRYPNALATGVDCWGGRWEYSRGICEKNAEIEGVADRTSFHEANAAVLPYEDGVFSLVVSNFVFHAVKDAGDKRDVIKEALRLVEDGGKFAFQDLFPVKKLYGERDDLVETVRSWGIREGAFRRYQ